MPDTVELRGIHKTYDHFVAVDHLSFNIREGSVYGLLGPNGAGKTSTIRMMIGINIPDEGEVWLFGEKFHREQLQRIGYLPEERGLYKRMKVLDHLIFLGRLHGMSAAERAKAIAGLVRTPATRRSGRRRRSKNCRRGCSRRSSSSPRCCTIPDLMILDEPFSGLDPANAVMLKDVMLELKKAGKTILFSTHRMDQVERLCESICLIDHGRSVLEGDLKKIKASYGKNTVQMQYEGDPPFDHSELIQSVNNYGNYVEVRLKPGADSQQLLTHGVAARPHQPV